MQNPLALLRDRMGRVAAPRPTGAGPLAPPYRQPGYKAPERMTALDYETTEARWPLVWVLDISGYDAVSQRASGQASFSLSGAHHGRAQTRLQCQVPLHEGGLFEKEGTYVVVAIPAGDEEQVREILSMAGR